MYCQDHEILLMISMFSKIFEKKKSLCGSILKFWDILEDFGIIWLENFHGISDFMHAVFFFHSIILFYFLLK